MPTFATPEPVVLTLTALVADVRLRAGDRTDTVVTISPRDPSRREDVEAAERSRAELTDAGLEVRGHRPWNRFVSTRTGGALDIEVDLPTGSELRGEVSVGDVHATGELGACRYSTSVGDLTFDRTGPATLSTHSRVTVARVDGPAQITAAGAIRVGELRGPATIKNLNGTTHVDTAAGDLTCRSANGDITLGTTLADVEATTSNGEVQIDEIVRGEVSLKTAYGRVEIGIRPGTAAHLDVHSGYGRVRNDLDTTGGPEASDELAGVRARTSYGDIVVRRPSHR